MASGILQQSKRAAVYARVSTSNNGQDPRVQTRELDEFCVRRGWTLVEYVDIGISGTKEKRPGLDKLMADAYKRRFDVVVVWRFDRFARSVSHLLRALETFNALGIAFVSLTHACTTLMRRVGESERRYRHGALLLPHSDKPTSRDLVQAVYPEWTARTADCQ